MMGKQSKCFCFPRMNNLSPAAQAVFNAADSVFDEAGTTSQGIAAALRAAADQVAEEVTPGQSVWGEGYVEGVIFFRDELLAIAAELEGAND
jgi:hypothetical protein